jgi:sugar lactone lactonase YvrE
MRLMRLCMLFLILLGPASFRLRAQLPVISSQPAGHALWAGGNATLAVGVSGAGPFSYQWQLDNTNLPSGIITTVAGGGTNAGDGGYATGAILNFPEGVTVDEAGNLYIADTVDGRIRKVDTNGMISTVAGIAAGSTPENNGLATNTSLNNPAGVTMDALGNLFIADSGNEIVREVNTRGMITSVAGDGTNGYAGDGRLATNASLNYPASVTVDAAGNVFIADAGNNVIRKIVPGGIITTVAGNGTNLYAGDGGPATNASLYFPQGVTVDPAGNLFIADSGNDVVREVTTNGTITTVAGGGVLTGNGIIATNARLNYPAGVVKDALGNLFITDYGNNVVRKVNTNGIITTVAGGGILSGNGIAATNASLNGPEGVTVDAYGDLFVATPGSNVVRKVTNTRGPVLALNHVTPADAGRYRVVVTGSGGSVTSSVVNLVVTATPLIYRAGPDPDGSLALNFLSQPRSTNVVFCATNLLPPIVWEPLATNIAGPDGNWQFTDTRTAGQLALFYRSLTH